MKTRFVILFVATLLVGVILLWRYLPLGCQITLIIIFSLAVGILLGTTFYSAAWGAPFVPTDRRNVAAMLDLAQLRPGERLADLGSGDGRILIAAARVGAKAEGWEVNPYVWLVSRWLIASAGVGESIKAHLGSYWSTPVSADVVSLFLFKSHMARMEKKLMSELRPGARVVSYVYRFPHWPEAASTASGVYLYVVPQSDGTESHS